MPRLKIIDSVKIDIYSREHPPPHVHVIFAEYEELIEIMTLETYKGFIPPKKRNKIILWIEKNQAMLLKNFKILNPRL
jgi:hypothetical protein